VAANGLSIEILGIDISERAVNLARLNLQYNIKKGLLHPDAARDIHFTRRDIRDLNSVPGGVSIETITSEGRETQAYFTSDLETQSLTDGSWDVIVSNPPYISGKELTRSGVVEKSVRKYEPRLALVPPDDDGCDPQDRGTPDLFYRLLVQIARKVDASLLVMEVGDTEQANRVLRIAHRELAYSGNDILLESWRDDSSVRPGNNLGTITHDPERAPVTSEEEISDRAVISWRGNWGRWRRDTSTPPVITTHQQATRPPRGIREQGLETRNHDLG